MIMWNRLRHFIAGTDSPAQDEVILPTKIARSPASLEEKAVLESLFGMQAQADAKPVQLKNKQKKIRTKRGKMGRDDIAIAAFGIALGVTCALFPWYIFFNQEKFGVREFVFSGKAGNHPAKNFNSVPTQISKPFAAAEVPKLELDFFPTATLPAEQEPIRAVPVSEQPFPSDNVNFRLVHVANGRAMIEDGDGLWVVQRGSQLPDASHVAAIEQRNGSWVLVTTTDKVIRLSR